MSRVLIIAIASTWGTLALFAIMYTSTPGRDDFRSPRGAEVPARVRRHRRPSTLYLILEELIA